MLRRDSRLDQEVLTWLAGLDAALVAELPLARDDFAKCVVNAVSLSAVVIQALQERTRRPVEEVRRPSLG